MIRMPQLSLVEFIATACYIVIFSFLWRLLAARIHNTPLGRAMAAVYT
ncbi:MAG: hypothetical protein JWO67_23 [Streptosporangiaceae bacterium]|nr:hypothetical protein [Streptosporangiaceae bacterium]